jgi:hypothetical protein
MEKQIQHLGRKGYMLERPPGSLSSKTIPLTLTIINNDNLVFGLIEWSIRTEPKTTTIY